jgi:hypothetical protein
MAHGVATSRCGVATVPHRGGRALYVALLLRTGSRRSASRYLPGRPGGVLTTAAARRDTPSPVPVADVAAATSAASSSRGACRAHGSRSPPVCAVRQAMDECGGSPTTRWQSETAFSPFPSARTASLCRDGNRCPRSTELTTSGCGAGIEIVEAAKQQLIELNEMAMYSKPAVEARPKVRLAMACGRPAPGFTAARTHGDECITVRTRTARDVVSDEASWWRGGLGGWGRRGWRRRVRWRGIPERSPL